MGEIAEALKRANAEREATEAASSESPAPAPTRPHGHGAVPTPPPIERPQRVEPSPPAEAAPPPPQPQRSEGPHARVMADELAERAIRSQATTPIEYGLDQLDLHRHLALRVRSILEKRGASSLMITSALRNEGKTTVSCNLALALASLSTERSVALVDLDLRNPSVGRRLRIPCELGMESVLSGHRTLEEICVRIDEPCLDVYPAGVPQRAAHELLVEKRFALALEDLCRHYSIVVIDTPPSLVMPDANLILQKADAWVAVAALGQSRVRRFNEMIEQLSTPKLVGKILDGVPAPKHQQEYYYAYEPDEQDER